MEISLDMIFVIAILTNLILLMSSRLKHCIRIVALQSGVFGLTPILLHPDPGVRVILITIASLLLKGFIFPYMLMRALREAEVRREIEPYVGYGKSLIIGVGLIALAYWISLRIPLPIQVYWHSAPLLAFFNIFSGLFLIVSRKKALTQVLGYLVMENGIYIFGVAFALEFPLLVEMGILLDVFVTVFVLGIIIFHINRQFDHIDMDRLTNLKDWNNQGNLSESGNDVSGGTIS